MEFGNFMGDPKKFPLFGEFRKAMQVGMQCFASVNAMLCKCQRNAIASVNAILLQLLLMFV